MGSRYYGDAFDACNDLTDIIIGDNVLSIPDNAFPRCINLTSVTIPNSVTNIEMFTFWRCTNLMSVTLPNSVREIKSQAFSFCSSLTEIINESATPQIIHENTFRDTNISACTLRVPAASLEAYRTAEGWKDFGNIVAIT